MPGTNSDTMPPESATTPKSIWLTTKTYELASYDRWSNLYVDMEELQEWRVRPAYTDEEIA